MSSPESSEFPATENSPWERLLPVGSSPEWLNRVSNAEKALRKAIATEEKELKRRERQYRKGREFPSIERNTFILVDDGLATGTTMRPAAIAIKQLAASRCVVAVPVGAPDACANLRAELNEVICVTTPNPFYAVGQFYRDFSQTTDGRYANY